MADVTWTNANGQTATTQDERTFVRASDGAVFVMYGAGWASNIRAVEANELTAMESQISGLADARSALTS